MCEGGGKDGAGSQGAVVVRVVAWLCVLVWRRMHVHWTVLQNMPSQRGQKRRVLAAAAASQASTKQKIQSVLSSKQAPIFVRPPTASFLATARDTSARRKK